MGLLNDILPDEQYEQITDIDIEDLSQRYDAVLIDLDCTLTSYHENDLTEEVRAWYSQATDRLETRILSNDASLSPYDRAERIEDELETSVIRTDHKKPRYQAFDDAMDSIDASESETAIIGDTALTDILGGNRYGIDTIQVQSRDRDMPPLVGLSHTAGDLLQSLADAIRNM